MTYEWTELSLLQKQSGKVEQFRDLRQNPFSAFVLGAVLVFFLLAGLYESWSLPMAVILVVPMCLLSALAGIALRGMDVNIFVQVGFVVLVGLACKNAILIVEFARDKQQEGASRFDAAVEAARVRLRPIVMTSACFVHMVPPYFATGAGAEMRRSLGTAVLWGAVRGDTLRYLPHAGLLFRSPVVQRSRGRPSRIGPCAWVAGPRQRAGRRHPVDRKQIGPKPKLPGAWCRELLPNRNERTHPRIAQKKPAPHENPEEQRREERNLQGTGVSGDCAAQIAREQDGAQDRGAWNQIKHGTADFDDPEGEPEARGKAHLFQHLWFDQLHATAQEEHQRWQSTQDPACPYHRFRRGTLRVGIHNSPPRLKGLRRWTCTSYGGQYRPSTPPRALTLRLPECSHP